MAVFVCIKKSEMALFNVIKGISRFFAKIRVEFKCVVHLNNPNVVTKLFHRGFCEAIKRRTNVFEFNKFDRMPADIRIEKISRYPE